MHTLTLEELLAEAKKKRAAARRRFAKYDATDDMHEANAWTMVIGWLKAKWALRHKGKSDG
jgi:hypothetical protein